MFHQYRAIKARYQDAILMFRMGDFYEMFFEDALTASRVLEITLTRRGRGTRAEAPMCGVPFHAVEGHIGRLTRAGFKVAVCDQLEDPARAKGLVKRDVTRVITPGTITDSQQLEAGEPNTLGAVLPEPNALGVAWVDLSTGDMRHAAMDGASAAERAVELLQRFNCREILLPEDEVPAPLLKADGMLVNRLPAWRFSRDRGMETLTNHLGTAHLEGFGLSAGAAALGAVGAILDYLAETQKTGLEHIDGLRCFQEDDHLILDTATLTNLEILKTQRDGRRQGSLLAVVSQTVTGMGGRLLKERLLHPLRDETRIRERLTQVHALVEQPAVGQRLRGSLSRMSDLERLLARLTMGRATPREARNLGDSLSLLPALKEQAAQLKPGPLREMLARLETAPEAARLLESALVDDPPATIREGGVIRDGHDRELDALRRLARDGRSFMAQLETGERKRTGISSLKVRYNKVFGYFIEVSKANISRVPQEYIRKQTLAGVERYVTGELKEMEEKLLTAEEKMLAREQLLFESLRREVLTLAPRIRTAAATVAQLDVAVSLARVAQENGWCRPEIHTGDEILIRDGRHPVVEAVLGQDRFVPNDIHLGRNRQIQIITGPNMGGKSTLLRQVGLIVLLAQAGSFVPASRARIGLADRIFCRVGASDSLAAGQSTFMVEMTETANILRHATPASLVLLDEIGRGTATFDGLSIAWAVVEHLHETDPVAARTLFATHYHELTELALVLPRVVNLRITVREHDGRIVFLHRLENGAADQSYGIQVAALAGVPREVVERAREILVNLESESVDREGRPRLAARKGKASKDQMGLFGRTIQAPALGGRAATLARGRHRPATPEPARAGSSATPVTIEERNVLRDLRAAVPERLTPLEALKMLASLRDRLPPGQPDRGKESEIQASPVIDSSST
ncbi:MAG: DNA mismatch repair protein MutS [Acidobacteriota bacterium]